MNVDGRPYRTIWVAEDGWSVEIIDQTRLPHAFATLRLTSLEDAAHAIRTMQVRGAPLIGATAAYGMALALRADAGALDYARAVLLATRPTAVNLRWALDDMAAALAPLAPGARAAAAYRRAGEICDEDVAICAAIGTHGLGLMRSLWEDKRRPERLNLLTHCNAGWLATGARRWRPSSRPTTPAYRCMSGSARRVRGIRAPASPPGSWPSTASRTRWSPTMPAAI